MKFKINRDHFANGLAQVLNVVGSKATMPILSNVLIEAEKDQISLTTTNLALTTQDTRTFNRFSDAAEEVVNARIYEGIHFRFADEVGRKQGRQVANYAFRNFLGPLGKHDADAMEDSDIGHQ